MSVNLTLSFREFHRIHALKPTHPSQPHLLKYLITILKKLS